MKDFIYANDLKKISIEKNSKRYKTYDKIIEKIVIRIKIIAANGLNNFSYEIPQFIPGLPLYNIQNCAEYIIIKLQEHGFNVQYNPPNRLFISWDLKPPSKSINLKK